MFKTLKILSVAIAMTMAIAVSISAPAGLFKTTSEDIIEDNAYTIHRDIETHMLSKINTDTYILPNRGTFDLTYDTYCQEFMTFDVCRIYAHLIYERLYTNDVTHRYYDVNGEKTPWSQKKNDRAHSYRHEYFYYVVNVDSRTYTLVASTMWGDKVTAAGEKNGDRYSEIRDYLNKREIFIPAGVDERLSYFITENSTDLIAISQ